uniref:Transmembrane protein n=1 Tax=Marseillevirus LCMAC101 TaxID=2506602 RepID=A0A481YT72_9VIRU|nr:MAG: hypothetical protein LCMAC101_05700 [Marseillevirus LCMAC101]
MADVWLDVFVGGFVVIALAFMIISAWVRVSKTVSAKYFGPSDPKNPSVLPYVIAAVFITIVSLIVIAYVHNLTTIDLKLPPRK